MIYQYEVSKHNTKLFLLPSKRQNANESYHYPEPYSCDSLTLHKSIN